MHGTVLSRLGSSWLVKALPTIYNILPKVRTGQALQIVLSNPVHPLNIQPADVRLRRVRSSNIPALVQQRIMVSCNQSIWSGSVDAILIRCPARESGSVEYGLNVCRRRAASQKGHGRRVFCLPGRGPQFRGQLMKLK